MTSVLTPSPRRGGRAPDHSGIRLPVIKRRYVPTTQARRSVTTGRLPLGGPPLRAA